MRTCPSCELNDEEVDFYNDRRKVYCKTCDNKFKKHRYRINKIVVRPQEITCPICKKYVTGSKINMDHDHNTGKFRGFLCSRCNKGLGFFCENTRTLRYAIKYLCNSINENSNLEAQNNRGINLDYSIQQTLRENNFC